MSTPALAAVAVAAALVALACSRAALAADRRVRRARHARSEVVAVRFRDRTVPEVSVANRGRRGVQVVSVVVQATWSDDENGHTVWNVKPVGVRLGRGETATIGTPLRQRFPPPRCTARVRTTVVLSDGSQVEDARSQRF